jgi:uncharacterized membrane protein
MPADSGSGSRSDDSPNAERLLALSDGVVAIALTLLVLQLRVPSFAQVPDHNSAPELAAQLGKGSGQLASYAISFYVIAQFWLVHHRVFSQIALHQEGLAWWNFGFLFTITIMPFTSNLLGEFSANPLAVDIFAFNLLLASLATRATMVVGRRKGLLVPQADPSGLRAGQARSTAVAIVICVSIAVAWVNTDVAKYCWLLIAVAQWAADRWTARRGGPGRLSA